MQKVLIIFALLAITTMASTHINMEEMKSLWSSWKIYNGKTYTVTEETARFAIFVENYKKVIEFNAVHENLKLAMNKFADLTAEEFGAFYTGGYIPRSTNYPEPAEDTADYSIFDLPASVDWRTKGAVTAVKNQGQCGSCWTFATTGVLEAWHFLNKNILLSFSEQQIVDCDSNDAGCSGGNPVEALTYTAQNGLELELAYPYTAQNGNCKYVKTLAVQTNGGSNMVGVRNSDGLKAAVVNQPVSVAIEADQNIFQLYSSGVIGAGCGASLDHAVLLVGYTQVGGEDAFIVKNSWGPSWGQNGYIYLSTDGTLNGGAGACGILSQPVVPT